MAHDTLTANDRRVLRAIRWACGDYDAYAPHGSSDWSGVRRLVAAGLAKSDGMSECQTCDEPHDGEGFVLTKAGEDMATI